MIQETLCPTCGGPMKSRVNNVTGQRFWGCAAFPKCTGTRNTDGDAPQLQDRMEDDLDDRVPSERQRSNDRHRWRNE